MLWAAFEEQQGKKENVRLTYVFICEWVLPACMSLLKCLQRPEEGIGSRSALNRLF